LLYIAHTTEGITALSEAWGLMGITRLAFCNFIMLYLSMEEWMHSVNTKVKVVAAQKLIAQILRMLKKIFPRRTGNGYNIPKFHGLAKILDYIRLFGSAINFFGGPGESHHKYFVKAPGDNTQRRVSEFAKQIANRIYESMNVRSIINGVLTVASITNLSALAPAHRSLHGHALALSLLRRI